jgi:hypothetical protein
LASMSRGTCRARGRVRGRASWPSLRVQSRESGWSGRRT